MDASGPDGDAHLAGGRYGIIDLRVAQIGGRAEGV
jgi:hypothetical protein